MVCGNNAPGNAKTESDLFKERLNRYLKWLFGKSISKMRISVAFIILLIKNYTGLNEYFGCSQYLYH